MSTKKSSKPADSPIRGGTKAAGSARMKAFVDNARRKAAASNLSPAERKLLKEIQGTPESERFDLLSISDRDTVNSLIRKGQIQVRTIQKYDIPGATITRKQARDAVLAVMRARDEAREGASG